MGNRTTGQNDWIKDKTMRQKEEMNPIYTQNVRKTKEKAEIGKKTAPAPSPPPHPPLKESAENGWQWWEKNERWWTRLTLFFTMSLSMSPLLPLMSASVMMISQVALGGTAPLTTDDFPTLRFKSVTTPSGSPCWCIESGPPCSAAPWCPDGRGWDSAVWGLCGWWRGELSGGFASRACSSGVRLAISMFSNSSPLTITGEPAERRNGAKKPNRG